MPTTRTVTDTFNRADSALVGSVFSDGSGTVWEAASGSPTVASNRVSGGGFAVANLNVPDNTVSATLWNGGRLVFRYQDANNYWYVACSIYSGQNADTPPITSYGYTWTIYRVVAGSASQMGSFNGQLDYSTWYSGAPGYPSGTYDPGHKLTVTTSGSTLSFAAEGGGSNTVSTGPTLTDSAFQTAGRFGVGGPADTFTGTGALLLPYVPAVML